MCLPHHPRCHKSCLCNLLRSVSRFATIKVDYGGDSIKKAIKWIFAIIAVLLLAVIVTGVVLTVMIHEKRDVTDPTVAALLMSLESVFSAICGVVFLKERFTLKEFIGILFIIAAIIVAQLPKREKTLTKKGIE